MMRMTILISTTTTQRRRYGQQNQSSLNEQLGAQNAVKANVSRKQAQYAASAMLRCDFEL
jgi:hypothetical protein